MCIRDSYKPDLTQIKEVAQIVKQGGIIIYPTETIYGLGGNALDREVVRKVYYLKKRPFSKPLSVLIESKDWVKRLVAQLPPVANLLIEQFWPGPLTVVLPATESIPEEIRANRNTIALRISSHPVCAQLLYWCQCPLISTSVNYSGEQSIFKVSEIPEDILQGVEAVIDVGESNSQLPSTVVEVTPDNEIKILREGIIPVKDILCLVE